MDTNKLAALLKPAGMGSGMLEQGKNTLMGRAYQLHVQEARALGQTPMTPEQFAASQRM